MYTPVEKLLNNIDSDQAVLITSKANIRYYSGFTSEDGMLYISQEGCYLLTDTRYTIQATEQAKGFRVIDKNIDEFWSKVSSKQILFEEDSMSVGEKSRLESKLLHRELIPSQKLISSHRQIKEPWEIDKIKSAQALGDMAFEHILGFIKPQMKESDIALELEFYMRKNGATALSFDTICASGVRSAMPHGTASNKLIQKGELLTLDFGCVLDGYCSDMTRTVIIDHVSDTRQEEIYNIVLKAQTEAGKGIKAGVKCKDADKIARDIITDAGYGGFFGHSLGHSVGLEIHECPNLSPKSQDTLSAGNVVSVEPGIYIEGFGGVRIEDLVAVTEGGVENLTRSPKELIVVR